MESFYIALKTIVPLFLIIFTGMILSRNKSVDEKWVKILNDYALWIGFPSLIFSALVKTKIDFAEFGGLLVCNSAYIVVSVFLAFPISRLLKLDLKTKRTLFFALAFGNVSYLGIPVLLNNYGPEIMPDATMISTVYLFWLFTLCIFLVEWYGNERQDWWSLLKSFLLNPMLLSVFLGLSFSLLNIAVPKVVMQAVDLFAVSVTALVLFSLGIFLGSQPVAPIREWIPVAGFSLLILFVLPSLFYLIAGRFFEAGQYRSWILEAAMPMGLTPYVLSVRYELNTGFASKVVVFSTLLSIVTLPLWIYMIG